MPLPSQQFWIYSLPLSLSSSDQKLYQRVRWSPTFFGRTNLKRNRDRFSVASIERAKFYQAQFVELKKLIIIRHRLSYKYQTYV